MFRYKYLILVILQFTLIIGNNNVNAQDFRLPKSIIPIHYALQLQPILDETPGYTRFTAPGFVTITVNCTEDTSVVKLHSLDITINQDATKVVALNGGESISINGFDTEPIHHFFVINLAKSLRAGEQYDIYLEFVTPVSQTRLDGMYLDEYVDPATNETRYVATTTFAAISARRCFPSFDEPQLKAIFSISLARKDGYHSLSNRHQLSTKPLQGMEGWHLDRFAPSLPMSTYLVAMIVSDMTFEEATKLHDADNTTIRVYAPYYFINRNGGKYAANQTKTVLAQYENYFDNIFMMDKLDSVSLPRFFFSAMENWGIITYNDQVLLYFPGETTEQERYRITSIIAHEVVHHYFGNLVTCEWWTWIWLNEGSATYWSHLGVELTYPEFQPWDRFVTDTLQVAMDYDTSANTHPVANEPQTTADIGGIYGTIAYQKGASLLRMMSSFLSKEVVQEAIRVYLKEFQFGNANQDDLFQKLQDSAETNNVKLPASIKAIMDTWTTIPGFPLLRVSRINAGQVSITQEKFQSSPVAIKNDKRWWIPVAISVLTPTPNELFYWISNQEDEIILDIPEDQIFIVNPKSEGYYRTLYSDDLLLNLIQQGCNTKMSSAGKAKIVDDYLWFTKTGIKNMDVDMLLEDLNKFLCLENENLVVWQTLFKYFTKELLQSNNVKFLEVASLMKRNVLPHIHVALNNTSLRQKQNIGGSVILRAELFYWTCLLDPFQPVCRSHTENIMKQWILGNKEKSPFLVDEEETYFCVAASMSPEYWNEIYHFMMKNIQSSGGKARILSALTCSPNDTLIQRATVGLQESFPNLVHGKDIAKLLRKLEYLPYIRAKLRLRFNGKPDNL